MIRTKFWAAAALVLMIAVPALAQWTLPAGAAEAAKAITEDELRGHVEFLASDLLEGRGPASRGDELARLYLATQLETLGLEPGMPDGTWQQPFDIVGVNATVPKTWSFAANGKDVSFDHWTDYIVASGVQNPAATVENAELVFVGYGIEAPEHKWDDFKGADLRGKILVMMNNDPDWDPALFEGDRRLYYGRWTYKYESAARQGAAGAIIIHTTPSAGYPWQVVQTSWSGEQFELPAVAGEPRIQLKGWMTEDAAKKLFTAAGKDLAKLVAQAKTRKFKPVPLGVTTSFALQNEVSRKKTANVLGVLPGSDLRDEYVIYTAHHDHLGIGEPNAEGDRIYNGALDNATGTAQLFAIAKAFTELPAKPRRSVMFLFVAAEEQGLLGSEYYAQNPTVHPGKIAANLNFDGGNVLGRTKDVVQIGAGKSNTDAIVKQFAEAQGRQIKPEQFPDRGSYYRSDQFNFAKIGVPAIYLDAGIDFVGRPEGWGRQQVEAWEAKHYHQPSDELTDEWNFEGMIEDAHLGFNAGLAIANADAMPVWNRGDEFEAARKKALADASAEHGTAVPAKGGAK